MDYEVEFPALARATTVSGELARDIDSSLQEMHLDDAIPALPGTVSQGVAEGVSTKWGETSAKLVDAATHFTELLDQTHRSYVRVEQANQSAIEQFFGGI
ncbi:hypothetical protein [uncultured Tessaracoccus sp.]|uniref:hypothetical protein n=1 Tax=uncultured Tessaracoccus sp. TaxID=905023 RepID=UPI0025F1C7AF|nr:hypothetical protein [uncultured Tessaracoccus sp.]